MFVGCGGQRPKFKFLGGSFTHIYTFFRILNILIHTQGERGEGLKEADSVVYPKGSHTYTFKLGQNRILSCI